VGSQDLQGMQVAAKKLAARSYDLEFELNPMHDIEALCMVGREKLSPSDAEQAQQSHSE
jgi:hypothetical protein